VGKATPTDFLRSTPGKLRRVGIAEETFWSIITENPRRALAITPPRPALRASCR
jgi:hypothetical protein